MGCGTAVRLAAATPPAGRLSATLSEERVKTSWLTIDRFCQEEAEAKEDVFDGMLAELTW